MERRHLLTNKGDEAFERPEEDTTLTRNEPNQPQRNMEKPSPQRDTMSSIQEVDLVVQGRRGDDVGEDKDNLTQNSSFDATKQSQPPPTVSLSAKQSLLAKMYQNKRTRPVKTRDKSVYSAVAKASKRVHPDNPKRELSSETLSTTPPMTNLLHNSCKLYSSTLSIIQSALMFDAEAIRKAVPTTAGIDINEIHTKAKIRKVSDTFDYPINIAICSGGSADVIELLANTGPDVLLMKDGPYQSCPLVTAIRHHSDTTVIQVLLAADHKQSEALDSQNSLPLHVAVQGRNVSMETVKLIYEAFPDAIKVTNIRGDTPVQVAERNPHCTEAIVDLLHDYAYSHHEDSALHLDDKELEPP